MRTFSARKQRDRHKLTYGRREGRGRSHYTNAILLLVILTICPSVDDHADNLEEHDEEEGDEEEEADGLQLQVLAHHDQLRALYHIECK